VATKAYRGRQQIIAKILNIIDASDAKGAPRTSIMYKAFLSHAQLKEYLSFLLENGLIDEVSQQFKSPAGHEKFVYKITGRGHRLLQISQEIENLIGLE
jgi:predicted transcriptional regulator